MKKKIIVSLFVLCAFLVAWAAGPFDYGRVGAIIRMWGKWVYPVHPTYVTADSLRITDKKYVDQAVLDAADLGEEAIGSQISDSLNAVKGMTFVGGTDLSIVSATGVDVDTLTFNSNNKYRSGAKSGDTINVASGTYTPTIADATNATSTSASLFFYSRSGNMVTVSGGVNYTVTTGSSVLQFTVTIPSGAGLGIETAAPVQVYGSGGDANDYTAYRINGWSGSTSKVFCETKPTSTGSHSATIIFQYRVK